MAALFPTDPLLVYPTGTHVVPELRRTWDEVAHHLDLARRRGEDVEARDVLFDSPEKATATLASLGRIRLVDPTAEEADVRFPLRSPEPIDRDIKRLRRRGRDGLPTVTLCDNDGKCDGLKQALN